MIRDCSGSRDRMRVWTAVKGLGCVARMALHWRRLLCWHREHYSCAGLEMRTHCA